MIRRATPADVDSIARVHVQAWRESYSALMPQGAIDARSVETRANQWRGTLAGPDGPTFVYVAEQDGAICGFGSAGKIRWTGLSTGSEVSALYLLDAVKRRGIGRAIFRRLLGELAARGFTSTGLWVLTRNAPRRRGASTRRWAAAAARRGSNAAVNMCSMRSPTSGTTLAPSR